MPHGYWDRILHVDLSNGKTWDESLGDDFWRKLGGGRGMIAHYLLTAVPAGADPLGPENLLIFAAGVLTGTPVPGAGRHSVGGRSPLTGAFGEGEAGGFWGAELRLAGWDGIVVHGQAEKPVYLSIKDDQVEVRDASHLWGQETAPVEDAIREELGDKRIKVAQIGIAGENLVKFALVVNDLNEVAGRSGMGAVMGSKRLKAVAVRGSKRVPVADPKPNNLTAKWVSSTMDQNHYNYHHYGTGAAMKGKHLEGHLIVRNFQDGQWPEVEKIDAVAVKEQFVEKMDGCYACSVRCKKRVRVEMYEQYKAEPKFGGPEYETLGALGTNLTIDNLPALLRANQRLNEVGIDSVSMGGTLAWAMECYERGLITDADTGGIPLRWGDADTVLQLIEMTARREGIGDLLADGALRASRWIGRDTEQYVVHVKGLEVAMHDPRGMRDKLENYPVTPTGGDHTSAAHHRASLRNMVGLCIFLNYNDDQVADLVRGVTGWDVSDNDLREVSARGLTMARLFNLREGFDKSDDRLPERLHQPIRTGPLSDKRLTEDDVQSFVESYYEQQGWDREGVPLPATIAGLGLDRYAAVPAGTVGTMPPMARPQVHVAEEAHEE